MRQFFGFLFFLPFIAKKGSKAFHTERFFLHILRVVFGICAVFFTYQSYRNLPLCTAMSIGFVGPAITAMLAGIVLKETITLKQWGLIFLGYVGVLFIAQPYNMEFNPFILSMLAACFFAGCSIVSTRLMSNTESRVTIMSYSNTFALIIVSLIIPFYWEMPSYHDIQIMTIVGAFGAFSQFCYISALSYESPSFVSPFEYVRLVIAIPVGYYAFHEYPNQEMIIGAVIIIIATYLLSQSQRKNN